MATVEGIVQSEDSNLLAKNGGTIVLSKHWTRSIMARIEFEEIPDNLILNWDHTGVNYIPV